MQIKPTKTPCARPTLHQMINIKPWNRRDIYAWICMYLLIFILSWLWLKPKLKKEPHHQWGVHQPVDHFLVRHTRTHDVDGFKQRLRSSSSAIILQRHVGFKVAHRCIKLTKITSKHLRVGGERGCPWHRRPPRCWSGSFFQGHPNTLALRWPCLPCLPDWKSMQSRAINRSGVIRNAEEEIRKELDKVHGQCRVGISFIRTAKYAQSLCNALLTIPIQAWSRVVWGGGGGWCVSQKADSHTFSVVCGIKSLPFWKCRSAIPATKSAEIYHHHLAYHS